MSSKARVSPEERARRGSARRPPRGRESTEGRSEVVLNVVEGAVGYHLRRAQTMVLEDVGRRIKPLGLAPPEFTVMSVLHANPGINATRIAESLPMKRSNLSVLLARLKRRGLVQRAEGEESGRVHSLCLTREGQALLESARRLHREHLRFLEGILGRNEMARLIKTLRKLGSYRLQSS